MTEAQQLVAAVRARTAGTRYVVTETARGFDLQTDLEDARWSTLLHQQRLSRTWIHHVRFGTRPRTFSVTDDIRDVSWGAGSSEAGAGSGDGVATPVATVSASRAVGRFPGRRTRVTYSPDGHGGYDKTVEVDDTGERGHELVRAAARELGWTEHRGLAERIGLYVGVGTVVALVVAGIAVGLLALTGRL